MIKLTHAFEGSLSAEISIYLNEDKIVSFDRRKDDSDSWTRIELVNGPARNVKETPDEILQLIVTAKAQGKF